MAEVHGYARIAESPPLSIGSSLGRRVIGVLRIGVSSPVDGVLGLGLSCRSRQPHLDARGVEKSPVLDPGNSFLSASSTRPITALSTFSVAVPGRPATAGASPKKFGSV